MNERLTVYLASRAAVVAHLRKDCETLTKRPPSAMSPMDFQATRLHDQVVRVTYITGQHRFRTRELRVCGRCSP